MSEDELVQDLALIGLGGTGIRTVLALRALIASDERLVVEGRENSCRLLAVDSNYGGQNYFRDLDDGDHEDLLLAKSEYLGLLHPGENPWDKVTQDAKSNIPEATGLLARRRIPLGMEAPVRSDYEAMIYVYRERMRQVVQDFIKNSEDSRNQRARPLEVIVASSLFGDSGSLSYLALLEFLTELSKENKNVSINAFLFAPEGFKGFFHLGNSHFAKYLSVIKSVSGMSFNENSEKFVPIQYLVSVRTESHVGPFPSVFEIFTETAEKLRKLIFEEFISDDRFYNDGGDSIIEVELLNQEKCLEIKNSFVDRMGADRHFSQLVREL